MGHLPPLHSLSTRNHSDGSGHFGKPSNKRESSLLLLADTGTQRETFTDTLSLCHPIESKPGCPLLQPWVSPAGREPALLKAAPELLTTPSSLCLAVKLTALHWECLGRRWRGGAAVQGGIKNLAACNGQVHRANAADFGVFSPHTFNQENKTSGQLSSHSSSTRCPAGFAISKALGPYHRINPPGRNTLLFHCLFIQFLRQNTFSIPRCFEADTENTVGCYRQKEGMLSSFPECLHFPTPFRSQLCR